MDDGLAMLKLRYLIKQAATGKYIENKNNFCYALSLLSSSPKVSVICGILQGGGIGPKLNLLPVGTGGLFSVWTLPLDQTGKVEPARDKGPSRHSSKGH